MATFAFVDAAVFVAGYDFSADLNEVGMELSADELDVTTFGQSYRNRIGGLRSVDITQTGFWQSATLNAPDPQAVANLSTRNQPVTVSPTGADGSTAYLVQAQEMKYSLGGKVGEVMPFDASYMSSDGVGAVVGKLLKPKTTVTGATSGTGVQLGTVTATQHLYTAVHCFTAGTTCDVIVESDDNGSFTSATTRSTTTVTAVGGTWVTRVAGAITDDYWRVRTASVTGTFSIAVAVGIR